MGDEGKSPRDIIKDATGVDFLAEYRRAEKPPQESKGCGYAVGITWIISCAIAMIARSSSGNASTGEIIVYLALILAGILYLIYVANRKDL